MKACAKNLDRMLSACITVFLSLMSATCCAQIETAKQLVGQGVSQNDSLELLISTNKETRFSAATQLENERKKIVDNLMGILASTNSNDVKMAAVFTLGEYRAAAAVPFMVDHLEWDRTNTLYPDRSIIASQSVSADNFEYVMEPVSSALHKIGAPAVPALLEKITQTDNNDLMFMCVEVCRSIEGHDVTQYRFQSILDKTNDPQKKERVQAALAILKQLPVPKK
jgi:HEAT repeat protein